MAVLEQEAHRLGLSDSLTLTGRMPRDEAFRRVRQGGRVRFAVLSHAHTQLYVSDKTHRVLRA